MVKAGPQNQQRKLLRKPNNFEILDWGIGKSLLYGVQ